MTSEEVNRFLSEQHTIEEYRDCLVQYFQGYLVDCLSVQHKIPFSEHIRMRNAKMECVLSFEPRRKHKKRRIHKKWAKKYGYRVIKAFVFPVKSYENITINFKIE